MRTMRALVTVLLGAWAGSALASTGSLSPPYPTGGSPKPPGPAPTGSGGNGGGANPGGPDVSTRTDTITRTTFIPCSTTIVSKDLTYYSTWLSSSIWTTTTCYPVP